MIPPGVKSGMLAGKAVRTIASLIRFKVGEGE